MTAAIILSIITAYIIGALISAPRLMRLIYKEKLALLEHRRRQYDEDVAAYKADRTGRTMMPYSDQIRADSPYVLKEARYEGWWWSLVWPFALTFHALGATAFRDEIAAQHAEANAKIIADYDALLASRFDKELETPTSRKRFRRHNGNVVSPLAHTRPATPWRTK